MDKTKKTYAEKVKWAKDNGYTRVYPYKEIGSNTPRWYKGGCYYKLSEIIR